MAPVRVQMWEVEAIQQLRYRDGSSVLQAVKRLKRQAMHNKPLAEHLARLKQQLSRVGS